MRKRAYHPQPAPGAAGDFPHVLRDLHGILVLAEQDCHVQLGVSRDAYDVEPESQVDTLLTLDGKLMHLNTTR